jgi:arsenate reductase
MRELTLYHNPGCSKSRTAKALLEERGAAFETVEYLKAPLSREDLEALGRKLGAPPSDWIRSKEAAYAEAGLSSASSEAEVLDAVAAHPILLERPILADSERAVVGRPPERVLELLAEGQAGRYSWRSLTRAR